MRCTDHKLHGTDVSSQSAVDEVVDRMDDYFLNREDWDTVVELGVGDRREDFVLKKTRSYSALGGS